MMQRAFSTWALMGAALLLCNTAIKAQVDVPIPNFDFSYQGNDGTLSGGLLSPPLTGYPLGSAGPWGPAGPWSASSTGALGLLLPATVDIGSGPTGDLTFSGVAIVSVLGGLVATDAQAFVTTGSQLQANSIYTLSFDLTAASLLDVGLLSRNGFEATINYGMTASSAGTEYVSTLSTPQFLSLALLSGTTQRATFTFATGAADTLPASNLGIRFAVGQANQLLDISALASLSIDNVQLTVAPVPEPGSVILVGLGALLLFRRKRGYSA